MKKKILLGTLIFLFFIALVIFFRLKNINIKENDFNLTNNQISKYRVSSYISDKQKADAENAEISLEINEEESFEDLVKKSENIVIVRIISLDSSSAEYDQVVGNTFGKLIINNVIKGELKEGQVVDYAATGGYLTINEWEKYQSDTANEKRDYIRKQNGIVVDKETSYIHLQFENNIDVEEGKTYLAYINFNDKMDKYEIVGFERGLMEISIEQEENTISAIDMKLNELKLKDNNSGKYELLNDYIEKIKENM